MKTGRPRRAIPLVPADRSTWPVIAGVCDMLKIASAVGFRYSRLKFLALREQGLPWAPDPDHKTPKGEPRPIFDPEHVIAWLRARYLARRQALKPCAANVAAAQAAAVRHPQLLRQRQRAAGADRGSVAKTKKGAGATAPK